MLVDRVPHSLAPVASAVPAELPTAATVSLTPDPREVSDVETSSDRYAHRFRGAVGAAFLLRQESGVLRLLEGLPRGACVLDVGGGHGQLVPGLLARGFRVTVVGSDDSCARRIAPWLRVRAIEFRAGDLLALPFPDRSFDAVVSIRLLGHARDRPRLLDELARVARSAVVVDFASSRSLNALASRLFCWKVAIEGDTRPFTVLDPREVGERLAAGGLPEIALDPQYLLPMAFYRLCRSRSVMETIERAAACVGATRAFGSPVLLRASRGLAAAPRADDRRSAQRAFDAR